MYNFQVSFSIISLVLYFCELSFVYIPCDLEVLTSHELKSAATINSQIYYGGQFSNIFIYNTLQKINTVCVRVCACVRMCDRQNNNKFSYVLVIKVNYAKIVISHNLSSSLTLLSLSFYTVLH